MKNLRRLGPALVVGLMIAVAGISLAQSANQATNNDKHSCCSVACDCCGDSCQMMKKDGARNHATSAAKEGCCGCCGDSCQMMKKDGAKNHATSAAKEGCCGCCGDSCRMMKKEGAKNHATAATKEGCCACCDSHQVKNRATAKATAGSDKHQCCCGTASCDMQHMKDAKDVKQKP